MTIARRDQSVLGVHVAGAVACGAAVLLFCLAGLRPVLARAGAAAAARDRLAAARQQRDAADADGRDAADRLDRLRHDEAATALVLMPPSRVNDVLARVAAVSADCGVRVDDERVGTLAAGDRYATLPVHAVGRGTYRSCVRFLHRLNHDCPDVGVASFSLVGSPDDAAAAVSIDVDLRWHAALPGTAR